MRKTSYIILLIISIISMMRMDISAQTLVDLPVELKLEKVSLQEAITQITEQTGVNFSYSKDILPPNKLVSISCKNLPLNMVLQKILERTPIQYREVGDQIVLYERYKSSNSTKKYTISGYVEDAKTGEKLVSVNVFHPKTLNGVYTNEYGFYSITLPKEEVELHFGYLGYELKVKKLDLKKDTRINIRLQSSTLLQEITVIANPSNKVKESPIINAQSIPMTEIKSMPSLGGEADVLQVMQLIPGVQSGNEGASGIYVRGGGIDQNLILLDEVTIYNPSHLFGFFSIFNADAIKSVDLIKSGIPSRYGERLSSVLDIRLKDGNKNQFRGSGSVGFLTAKLTLEIPVIKEKTSVILSARRSLVDALLAPYNTLQKNREGNKINYYFYDANAKINHKFSDKDQIYFGFFKARDVLHIRENTGLLDSTDTNRQLNENRTDWGNFAASARWTHLINHKTFTKATIAYSNYTFNSEDIFEDLQKLGTDSTTFLSIIRKYNSKIQDANMRFEVDVNQSPTYQLKMGINGGAKYFQPGSNAVIRFQESSTPVDTVFNDVTLKAYEFSAYAENRINIQQRFKANIGLRASVFSIEGSTFSSLQPRVALSWEILDKTFVRTSFDYVVQHLHLLTNTGIGLPTDLWVPSYKNIKPENNYQLTLGFTRQFDHNVEFSMEGFYKRQNNLLSYRVSSAFLLDGENWNENALIGKGWAYGSELFLQKKAGKFLGWVGYTLSWSFRQFDEINEGKKYPFKYDRRHDISIALIYKLNKNVKISGSWVYGSGNAVTLPISEVPLNDPTNPLSTLTIFNYGERNNFRMSPFHRLNLGAEFYKKKEKFERTIRLSIYNAYNRKNPFYITIGKNERTGEREFKQVSLFPIIPTISYDFKF